MEAEIRRTPLCSKLLEDKIIWIGNSTGRLTLRNAYNLVLECKNQENEGESSNSNGSKMLWKKFWQTKLPNKIRFFAWCANPPKEIWKGEILQKKRCEVCKKSNETVNYALWECQLAKEVWRINPLHSKTARSPKKMDFTKTVQAIVE